MSARTARVPHARAPARVDVRVRVRVFSDKDGDATQVSQPHHHHHHHHHHPSSCFRKSATGAWTMADSGSGEQEDEFAFEIMTGVGIVSIAIVVCLAIWFFCWENAYCLAKVVSSLLAAAACAAIVWHWTLSDNSEALFVWIGGVSVAVAFGAFHCWHWCYADKPPIDGQKRQLGFKRIIDPDADPKASADEAPLMGKVMFAPLFVP